MKNNHMTIREKLDLQKQIKERNEQRAKEFAAKQAYNEKLLDLYIEAKITKEQFEQRYKK